MATDLHNHVRLYATCESVVLALDQCGVGARSGQTQAPGSLCCWPALSISFYTLLRRAVSLLLHFIFECTTGPFTLCAPSAHSALASPAMWLSLILIVCNSSPTQTLSPCFATLLQCLEYETLCLSTASNALPQFAWGDRDACEIVRQLSFVV